MTARFRSKAAWALFCVASLPVHGVSLRGADGKELSGPGEAGITREQADDMLKELRQIRLLLENQQKAPKSAQAAPSTEPVKMKIGTGPFLGRPDAPLTLVEFSDYQCPFCKQFHTATFDQLRKEYIDQGKLRFISRDLPLEMHSNAGRAAQAARCAGDQGRFWQMRDLLIANAGNLGPEALLVYAHRLSLDAAKFSGCLETGQHQSEVQEDADLANSLGIIATPTFILGRTTAEGVDGVKFLGALPYAAFDAKVKELLVTQTGRSSAGTPVIPDLTGTGN